MKATVIFLLVLFGILFIRYVIFFKQQKQYRVGQLVSIGGRLIDEPRRIGNTQWFYLGRIRVSTKNNIDLHYGDKIRVNGLIEQDKFKSKGVIQNILLRQKNYIVKQASVKIIDIDNIDNYFFSFLKLVRERISSVFNSYLSPRHSGLLLGIVLGVRGGIDRGFSENLIEAGVLHVVAASGMNVSILAGSLISFLILFLNRRLALFVTCAAIVFYCFLSGFSTSIIRASIMGLFSYAALILGRQNTSYLALCFAGFLILLFDPAAIADIGFELSFLSTLGILVFSQNLQKLFQKLFHIPGVASDAATTVSAQLVSLPILISSFSSYAPVSLVVNTLVLWTIPYLMALGALAAVFSLIAPVLAVPLLFLCFPLLLFFEKIVFFFGDFSNPLIIPDMPSFVWIGYYCLLLAFAAYMYKKRKA